MRSLKSAALCFTSGVVVASSACLLLSLRFPAFFAEGIGQKLGFVLVLAAVPAALAGLLGAFTKRGAALAFGALCFAVGAGLALLDLPTPSPAGVGSIAIGSALVGFLVADRPWMRTRAAGFCRAGLAIALFVAAAAAPKPPHAPLDERPKILFYGLDAGTWTILDELFAKEQLPNLRRIRDEGTSGVLESELASLSPRVWTTIATGKTPDRHGVLDFFCTQNQHLKTRRLWEMLQARGWSVGLFQWLLTWPPDPFDPFVVPAWMARGPETHPRELGFIKQLEISLQNGELDGWIDRGETLKAVTKLRDWGRGYLEHGLRLSTLLEIARVWSNDPDHPVLHHYAAKRMTQLLLNGDVYLDLYRRHQPDFSAFIAYGTDNLAHKYWQYHFPDDFGIPRDKAAPYANLLADYYRACDRLLGEILPFVPPQTTIAVVSDHGFTSAGVGGDSHQREHRPRMNRIATLLELTEADVTSSSVATRGYFRPVQGSPRTQEVVRRINEFLAACTKSDGGTDGEVKVFLPRNDPAGEIEVAVNLGPEFELSTPIHTPLGPMTYGDLVDIEERTGNHSIQGILLLRGPHIRRGRRIEGARLLDLTPTMLYLHGQPVGADMDGKVLADAIDPAFRDEHEIERIASWDDEVTITRDESMLGDDSAWRKTASELGYVGDAPRSTPEVPPKDASKDQPEDPTKGRPTIDRPKGGRREK